MEVYLVKTLWRNDDDFDCITRLFSTYEKAKEYFEQEKKSLMVDFNIDLQDSDISFEDNGKDYVEYSCDWDYFNLSIIVLEVE